MRSETVALSQFQPRRLFPVKPRFAYTHHEGSLRLSVAGGKLANEAPEEVV